MGGPRHFSALGAPASTFLFPYREILHRQESVKQRRGNLRGVDGDSRRRERQEEGRLCLCARPAAPPRIRGTWCACSVPIASLAFVQLPCSSNRRCVGCDKKAAGWGELCGGCPHTEASLPSMRYRLTFSDFFSSPRQPSNSFCPQCTSGFSPEGYSEHQNI